MYCRNWRTKNMKAKQNIDIHVEKVYPTISVNLSNKINEKLKVGFY